MSTVNIRVRGEESKGDLYKVYCVIPGRVAMKHWNLKTGEYEHTYDVPAEFAQYLRDGFTDVTHENGEKCFRIPGQNGSKGYRVVLNGRGMRKWNLDTGDFLNTRDVSPEFMPYSQSM